MIVLKRGAAMTKGSYELIQDENNLKLIDSSLYRCKMIGLPAYDDALPQVTDEMKLISKSNITGQTLLIRDSQPQYYNGLSTALTAHDACLFFVAADFYIYGRLGNEELAKELKAINFRVGTNVGEEVIGTNAPALAARNQNGVWTIGEQNYAGVLKNYAMYSFTVHGRYGKYVHILLICRTDKLNKGTVGLFKLVEATETLSSGGFLTEDIVIKDKLLNGMYNNRTESMMLILGRQGTVTYANDLFYRQFGIDFSKVINRPVEEVVPELAFVRKCLTDDKYPQQTRSVKFAMADGCEYNVSCDPIISDSAEERYGGVVITAQRVNAQIAKKSAEGSGAKYTFDDIIGSSPQFEQLKQFAARIANTKCTVMIRGESGTGKELFAHSIHSGSNRWGKPFISINCAAIPRELIGSELFGYVGGAFTGANRQGAKGKFELASGGTLFLDEIGEMPIDMQSVLLRVLEENAITRIGGSKPIPIDCRLIVATNQDLEKYIEQGKFRLDLYYRLNVVSLNMIPLREHPDDIFDLANSFAERFSKLHKKTVNGFSPQARRALLDYDWPGNVRELRNAVEYAVITCNGAIELYNLPDNVRNTEAIQVAEQKVDAAAKPSSCLQTYRMDTVERLMREYDGNKSKVAKQMGIARTTLYRILDEIEKSKNC